MKKYTFEVVINEGSDHFWDNLKATGCDEVLECIQEELMNWDAEIRLVKYEDK